MPILDVSMLEPHADPTDQPQVEENAAVEIMSPLPQQQSLSQGVFGSDERLGRST